MVCRLAATGTGGSGSFPALRDTVARVDEMGTERVRGTGIVRSKGEHVDALVTRLLTTAFLIGCCTVFDTIFDGGFVSPFEGQGGTACVGGSFGDEQAAGDKGERIGLSICSLLTTILFPGHFVGGKTST